MTAPGQGHPGDPDLAAIRVELAALRAELAPLIALVGTLAPLLGVPKIRKAIDRAS